ncbi:MAG: cation:proton antiporter [Candidatus Omnitrophota bacterium]|nr:cation:proton antiporter [Candidatus Omnitrophota bacterium]
MGTPGFLTEFILVLITATIVAVTFERLRLPSILGFLIAGVIVGPHGFGILTDSGRIHQMAELGVMLLMLTIGLEFSMDRMRGLKNLAVFGGTLQILLSILVGFAFAWWRDRPLYDGFFFGSVIALSSTAIVLKFLIDRGELDTQYGRIAVAILLFQDIAVVPLLIFTTGLGQPSSLAITLGMALVKTLILLAAVVLFSRFLLPRMMHRLAVTRNREIVFLTAVVVCLGTAWLSEFLGLSLAIGAFFAGFMFANTDFRSSLIGDITPFRYIFVSVFFVSIGLLFDIHFALENAFVVSVTVGLVLLVNFVLMTVLITCFGMAPRVALAAGILLSQIGEFSLLLLEAGRASGGIDLYLYHVLLSTAFLTMLMTPVLFKLVPLVLSLSERIGFFGTPPADWKIPPSALPAVNDHVILCGFGPSGQDLALTFLEENIPFVLVELNHSKVQEARKKRISVIYGDAANREVMKRAGIERARAVVVSFPDIIGMVQVIRVIQQLNSQVMLAVRTRYETEMPRLYELGADMVVMEEWEASYELSRLVMRHLKIPEERIGKHLERIRARKELALENAILKQTLDRPS